TRFKCDWSSDVCSSDLLGRVYLLMKGLNVILFRAKHRHPSYLSLPGICRSPVGRKGKELLHKTTGNSHHMVPRTPAATSGVPGKIGRASCRDSVAREGA